MDFAIVCQKSTTKTLRAKEHGEKIAEQAQAQKKMENFFDVEALLNIYCISKCIRFVNVNFSIYSGPMGKTRAKSF